PAFTVYFDFHDLAILRNNRDFPESLRLFRLKFNFNGDSGHMLGRSRNGVLNIDGSTRALLSLLE
ncbi:MAG: hypothetical protein OEY91_13775, partial [Nitrospirota bacterium]|nr:hypothetical protein [Nitrospirota bacterium]